MVYHQLRRKNLVRAMLLGDKHLPHPVPAARDNAGTRLLALVLAGLAAGLTYWVVQLGNQPMLG